jgi:hypothetical protein
VHSLSWKQVLAWRMERHHLVRRAPRAELLAVASRICGLHAQVMSSAELTLWARIEDLEPGEVRRALWEDRTLVKLWAMRGTLHLLPASELGLWLGGLGTYDHYLKPYWLRGNDITGEELEQLIEAIGRSLDGELRTRAELAAAVARETGSSAMAKRVEGSWGAYLKPASYRGSLCFGPGEGQRVRFTRPSGWVRGRIEKVDPERAMREITRRYLGAFAPATREDLARWWSRGSPAMAGRMLEALGDEATELEVDGDRCWMLTRHAREAAGVRARNVARLLPGFDQWVVGASRTVAAQLDPEHRQRVHRPQGWISPVLLVNGRIDGVWRHRRRGKRLLVAIEPFRKLPGWARAQTEREARRLAETLGGELELSWE